MTRCVEGTLIPRLPARRGGRSTPAQAQALKPWPDRFRSAAGKSYSLRQAWDDQEPQVGTYPR